MKTKIIFFLSFLFLSASVTFAQTVEDRVKDAMDKLAPLALDDAQKGKTDTALVAYYTGVQKIIDDAKAAGKEVDPAQIQAANEARNTQLKTIFTEDQFTKFKNELEALINPSKDEGA